LVQQQLQNLEYTLDCVEDFEIHKFINSYKLYPFFYFFGLPLPLPRVAPLTGCTFLGVTVMESGSFLFTEDKTGGVGEEDTKTGDPATGAATCLRFRRMNASFGTMNLK
jgi:hypothetical protein